MRVGVVGNRCSRLLKWWVKQREVASLGDLIGLGPLGGDLDLTELPTTVIITVGTGVDMQMLGARRLA
jgi:hypothetical protein